MINSTSVITALSKNALFSMDIKVHGRSSGADITKLMAYRGGCRMVSELTGKVHSYTRKRNEIAWSAIQIPALAPPEWIDRRQLAIAIDAVETKCNSQLVREIVVALPRELHLGQQIVLIHQWVDEFFVRHGVVASWDIHHKPGNPHAHILLTMREVTPAGFGKKIREWNDHRLAELCRASFGRAANRQLRAIGSPMRMNHRSFARRGINVLPTIHEGPHLPQNEDVWRSKRIYNDYIKSLRPPLDDTDGGGGGTGGGDIIPGGVGGGCPTSRSSRLPERSDVVVSDRKSMARPRRRKAKGGQGVTGWGEPK